MKALKISLVLGLILAVGTYFNNSIAQTFGHNESEMPTISSRQKLTVDLLKLEIANNEDFTEDKANINYELDFASKEDEISSNCYKYTPLLINAINSNEKRVTYYNLQGNFGYTFENANKNSINFNFYEYYNDNGTFDKLITSITIQKDGINYQIDGPKAIDYIVDNYCKPLNQILDQNSNRPIPQLLEILKQRFSK